MTATATSEIALRTVTLEDKYTAQDGTIFLSGVQALVRLPMMQKQVDEAAGLDTRGFISGYRGSPLAGVDQQLWNAKKHLEEEGIVFKPGINEELGATAVWGTQQAAVVPGAKHDGVFGMFYAKGPGLDRSMDVLKHANHAGTSEKGGVLVLMGDDHGCDSSTIPHSTDYAIRSAFIHILNPADVQEMLEYGLYGWQLSRYSGCWVAMKTIAETVLSSGTVNLDEVEREYQTPEDFTMPEGGLGIRWPDPPLPQEERLNDWKIPAVKAFTKANPIDRVVIDCDTPRMTIATTGKAHLDVMQAINLLGMTPEQLGSLGVRLYKVGLTWPLEREGLLNAARGTEELLVVEEKASFVEAQARDIMYDLSDDQRPAIFGKLDEQGRVLFSENSELEAAAVAISLGRRLVKLLGRHGVTLPAVEKRIEMMEKAEGTAHLEQPLATRMPHYCPGCPHNSSTKVPEGSRGMVGIGCHYMVQWMGRDTEFLTQMGGEGVPFVGIQPFSNTKHMFVNLGDGTYQHSGHLAIRMAVSSGINATYKVLYNDAVAMTGGQQVDGGLTVPQIAHQLVQEKVKRVVVVTDDESRYDGVIRAQLPAGVVVEPRHRLDHIQRELRDIEGVTTIIYDQTCAAEKRRRRKRGQMEDPQKRVIINDLVCEGCGDCSVQSNCIAILPKETEFGRKRQIDQSNCNKDFSCVEGFCPSFVTVKGGKLKAPAGVGEVEFAPLPMPEQVSLDTPFNLLITGVGGTGVVTISALIGMAAHLEGKASTCLDQTGLAQKGGAVVSHVRLANSRDKLDAVRLASGQADAIMACDMVVTGRPDVIGTMDKARTSVILNGEASATSDFTFDRDYNMPVAGIVKKIRDASEPESFRMVDSVGLATALLGNAVFANAFMLGHAWQLGHIPLSEDALLRAIELNGVAIDKNKAAFEWGRRAAHDIGAVEAIAYADRTVGEPIATTLEDILNRRVAFLTEYQSSRYAGKYEAAVRAVALAEEKAGIKGHELAKAAARGLFKLMSYKDEYEVARLYTDGHFKRQLEETFEGDIELEFNLAPPILTKRDPKTGQIRKRKFGPWMLKGFEVMSKFKGLRGTPFDLFGYTAERKMERGLIDEYKAILTTITDNLSDTNHDAALTLTESVMSIRGYGHVKEAAVDTWKAQKQSMINRFLSPETGNNGHEDMPMAAE
ncbi:MAG: indolepyruvate ferredoxin oxidoreductase family protein [Alphaproteobacteria bacterium]